MCARVMHVLIAGATGLTGRRLSARLVTAGDRVRALCRNPSRARDVLPEGVEIVRGDLRDPSSLRGAGANIDVAVIATGTRSYFGDNGGKRVDAEGTRELVAALRDDGVRRVVLLGAFGLDRSSPWLRLFSRALNDYFRWKALAEQAVRESGLEWLIVRPVELSERAPRARPLLNQTAELSLLRTVSRDSVAEVLAACVHYGGAWNKTFELCEGDTPLGIDAQLDQLDDDRNRRVPARTPLCAVAPK